MQGWTRRGGRQRGEKEEQTGGKSDVEEKGVGSQKHPSPGSELEMGEPAWEGPGGGGLCFFPTCICRNCLSLGKIIHLSSAWLGELLSLCFHTRPHSNLFWALLFVLTCRCKLSFCFRQVASQGALTTCSRERVFQTAPGGLLSVEDRWHLTMCFQIDTPGTFQGQQAEGVGTEQCQVQDGILGDRAVLTLVEPG